MDGRTLGLEDQWFYGLDFQKRGARTAGPEDKKTLNAWVLKPSRSEDMRTHEKKNLNCSISDP